LTRDQYSRAIRPIEVKSSKSVSDLLSEMRQTGFQGKKLGEVADVWEKMLRDKGTTIIMGYAGSLSVAGQWKIINWLISNRLIDVLVSTGANISEDIVEAMGYHYWQGDHRVDDKSLGSVNRYYDVFGRDSDYMKMTNVVADFIIQLRPHHRYTTWEFLYQFGTWLYERNIRSIVAVAARYSVPVFCPAIIDSCYGDAILLAKAKGFDIILDQAKDFVDFTGLAERVKETGVIYVGGGVPKDFIQLLAVSSALSSKRRKLNSRQGGSYDSTTKTHYYPHKYAIQITTDSPQWGGLSGATFEEAISWGKISDLKRTVQCYCDATIALPIVSHALSERKHKRICPPVLTWLNGSA
jgi:deoxyhypusine synthase